MQRNNIDNEEKPSFLRRASRGHAVFHYATSTQEVPVVNALITSYLTSSMDAEKKVTLVDATCGSGTIGLGLLESVTMVEKANICFSDINPLAVNVLSTIASQPDELKKQVSVLFKQIDTEELEKSRNIFKKMLRTFNETLKTVSLGNLINEGKHHLDLAAQYIVLNECNGYKGIKPRKHTKNFEQFIGSYTEQWRSSPDVVKMRWKKIDKAAALFKKTTVSFKVSNLLKWEQNPVGKSLLIITPPHFEEKQDSNSAYRNEAEVTHAKFYKMIKHLIDIQQPFLIVYHQNIKTTKKFPKQFTSIISTFYTLMAHLQNSIRIIATPILAASLIDLRGITFLITHRDFSFPKQNIYFDFFHNPHRAYLLKLISNNKITSLVGKKEIIGQEEKKSSKPSQMTAIDCLIRLNKNQIIKNSVMDFLSSHKDSLDVSFSGKLSSDDSCDYRFPIALRPDIISNKKQNHLFKEIIQNPILDQVADLELKTYSLEKEFPDIFSATDEELLAVAHEAAKLAPAWPPSLLDDLWGTTPNSDDPILPASTLRSSTSIMLTQMSSLEIIEPLSPLSAPATISSPPQSLKRRSWALGEENIKCKIQKGSVEDQLSVLELSQPKKS